MANIFNYGLVGVGGSVQLGKGGAGIKNEAGVVQTRNAADDLFADFEAANITGANGDFSGTMDVYGDTTVSVGNFEVTAGTATFGGVADFTAGTAELPGITFTGATDTGIALGTNALVLAVEGAASLTLNDVDDSQAAVAVFGGTTAITLPVGAEGDRPTTGATAGMVRFTTDGNVIEYYDGTDWADIGGLTFLTFTVSNAGGGSATGGPVVADSPDDTLALIAGVGIDLTASATADSIEISFTNEGLANASSVATTDEVVFFNGTTASVATFQEVMDSLDIVNGISADGILVRTAEDTYASREIAVDGAGNLAGLAVYNGNGVGGDPTLGLDIANLAPAAVAIEDADLFVMYDAYNDANVAVTALQIQQYAASATDPLVRRATVAFNATIGDALPTPASGSVYVTRIVINVTTVGTGPATLTDGTNVLVTDDDWDATEIGTYVVELPVAVASTSGQLQFVGGTGGEATVTVEYKIA